MSGRGRGRGYGGRGQFFRKKWKYIINNSGGSNSKNNYKPFMIQPLTLLLTTSLKHLHLVMILELQKAPKSHTIWISIDHHYCKPTLNCQKKCRNITPNSIIWNLKLNLMHLRNVNSFMKQIPPKHTHYCRNNVQKVCKVIA
jgi:hypothetical protein